MNIGIVTTWFERGAAYVSRQFEEILSQKHNVYIYARGGEKYAKGDPEWDKQNVYWSKRIYSPLIATAIQKNEFLKWIKKNNIEAIIFNEQHWFQPILWCKENGIKTVAYIDYYNEKTIPLFNAYDALICNTKRHLQAFEKHNNAYYIPWGTDTDKFVSKGCNLVNNNLVTFFHSSGINGYRKGTDLFIQALSLIKEDFKAVIHTQLDLIIQFPKLKSIINKLEDDGKLIIINKTCPAPGLYYFGDVYVYPSRLEGIGLTIAESISSGLACIVTDNPPMNEFVNNDIGCKIPVCKIFSRQDGYYWPQSECDINKLAEILQYYASNKELVISQKNTARNYAIEHLSYKKNFSILFDLFDSITLNELYDDVKKQINSFDTFGIKKYQKYFIGLGLHKLLSK